MRFRRVTAQATEAIAALRADSWRRNYRGAFSDAFLGSGLYLWVLQQNGSAQAFYRARGGTYAGREPFEPPGGTAMGLRFVWPDPATLIPPGL